MSTTRCASQSNTDLVLKELDNYARRTSKNFGDCPFALVVSKKGKVIYEKYGQGKGVLGPIDENSKWQLFSITKSFVSALILKLVDEEVLSLDDKVGMYLPEFKVNGNGKYSRNEISIRNLASHTSGVSVNGDIAPRQFPVDLNEIEIISKPGKDFHYSGLGMHILERTIEAATQQDLGELLGKYIFAPLSLNSASYVYDMGDANGPVLPLRPNDYYYSKKGGRAGSGLFINALDLNKFGQFWLDPQKLFGEKLKMEVWKKHGERASDNGDYGLLWWLFEDLGGYVMSGAQYKINAVVPKTEVVITLIRLPQTNSKLNFYDDKVALVKFGNRL